MLQYIHTENTSKAIINESDSPQTSIPRALLSQELIFHSMLSNEAKETFSNRIRKTWELGNTCFHLG